MALSSPTLKGLKVCFALLYPLNLLARHFGFLKESISSQSAFKNNAGKIGKRACLEDPLKMFKQNMLPSASPAPRTKPMFSIHFIICKTFFPSSSFLKQP